MNLLDLNTQSYYNSIYIKKMDQNLSPLILLANWISLVIMVTLLA